MEKGNQYCLKISVMKVAKWKLWIRCWHVHSFSSDHKSSKTGVIDDQTRNWCQRKHQNERSRKLRRRRSSCRANQKIVCCLELSNLQPPRNGSRCKLDEDGLAVSPPPNFQVIPISIVQGVLLFSMVVLDETWSSHVVKRVGQNLCRSLTYFQRKTQLFSLILRIPVAHLLSECCQFQSDISNEIKYYLTERLVWCDFVKSPYSVEAH